MIQQNRKANPKPKTTSTERAKGASSKKAGLGAMSFADAEKSLSPEAGASAKPAKKGALQRGDEGPEVTDLQLKLKRMSKEAEVDADFRAELDPGKIDGKFGAGTERGVRAVQSNNQLPLTGVYDVQTAAALAQELDVLDQMKASME